MYRLIQAGTRPSILLMVAKVYIPVLFPLTFGIGLLAMWMDKILGFEAGFIPEPYHFMAAALSLGLGIIAWLSTYEQLSRVGAGSPSPTAGRTTRLVRTGWYAHSRNPSLFGKTLGVLAVGLLLNSVSFCFILIPVLLTGSLFEKVWRQEPQLVEVFGEEYERYRKEVPLFIPWRLVLGKRKHS
jgi:protein-S-isoprenylcysteine O-methyltransferase Ste14